MNHSGKAYSTLICLISALATPALAQQPPDLVKSDDLANTAMGTNALLHVNLDESGCHNTASGDDALYSDTSGSYNTGTGFSSLFSNTTGNDNVAVGYESLYFNSTGDNNTASGYAALYSNTTGGNNTAVAYKSLYSNTTGTYNNAVGVEALYTNTTGADNDALGADALFENKTGIENIAIGSLALYHNTTGNDNVAIGFHAGNSLTSGSYDIYISNVGVATESGIIRIGTSGTQTAAYISGIESSKVTGSAVYITSSGQLGVLASSERYKIDVQTMGPASGRLDELRPVTFKLKTDPEGPVQYGLIAEEVAKVYPELVTRAPDGRISGVRYEELAPMLLNELQGQKQRIAAQEAINSAQAAEIRDLKQQQKQFATQEDLKDLQQQLQAALAALQSENKLVARR
jgi:hypothetical protein